MTFEEIREEMLQFGPIAKHIRQLMKVERLSDSVAVEMLKAFGPSLRRRR
jgi:hypothetical protein